MTKLALLEVRVMPWRPRTRVMSPDVLRGGDPLANTPIDLGLQGVVLGLVLWLVVAVLAPVIVLVLAAVLLAFELPVVLAVGVVLLVVRFAGVVPWTVVVIDGYSGAERWESHRNLWHAVRRIREVNGHQRVRVRWAWF